MNRILIINPNSSTKMTEDIRDTVQTLKTEDWEFDVIRIEKSPLVLESFTDYTLAGANVLDYLEENDITGYKGILLACFGDPCLWAIKEQVNIPVIGIAEASISLALLLGFKYSIIAAVPKAKAMMESLVMSYGLLDRMASVEALNVEICTFMEQRQLLEEAALSCGKRATEKGADVLILGCAGMTILGDDVEKKLGVPVIDPIKAGICTLKGIIDEGFSISKAGLFS